MQKTIRPITAADRRPVMDIFNCYVEHSFAAFPEAKLPYETFDLFLNLSVDLPAGIIELPAGEVVGFGMLRRHNQLPVFSHTVEAACFIHPDHTGRGLGRMLLGYLEKGAVACNITNILACVSSLNPGSIRFHRKNGFIECGRFREVGRKKGRLFDTVWLQKRL